MLRRTLYIGRWIVDILFFIREFDSDVVLDYLECTDISEREMSKVQRIMDKNRINSGFTYPDRGLHYIVVVIGPTTSGAEFKDTLVHEIHHVAVVIAKDFGIDLDSEIPAYLSGDSVRALADVVCMLGCSCCHDNTGDFYIDK